MESNKHFTRNVILLIIFAVLLGALISYLDRDKTYHAQPTVIPPPPASTGWHYNFNTEEWEPIYSQPRANDNIAPQRNKGLTEDDLQDYLEDHVDEYLEDTYWGEEYDLNDKE